MAVQRRVNWISQQRVDVPDMRSVESAASNDFDQLFQAFVTGTDQGYIIRGFNILMANAIGGASNGLLVQVDPGAVMHIAASQSGTILMVPAGTSAQQLNAATNSNVVGAFSPSAINYVTLDYVRTVDDATAAQVYLWDPTTNTETTVNAPRAQVLRYTLNISTATPTPNLLPIATVLTDAGNNVLDITDERWLLYRLATGGATPNPFFTFPWPQGRTENPFISSSDSIDPFYGGDKAIGTLKDWMNAIMSSLLEIKGTTYWYSSLTSGSMQSLREDLGNTVITGAGNISHGIIPNSIPVLVTTGDIVFGVNQITNLASTTGLVIGQYIFGTGILTGTKITNISGSTVDISTNATQTIVGGMFAFYDPAAITAPGQINWDLPINIRVIGSALNYVIAANPNSTDISLVDDSAAYITLVRGVAITPNLIFTNGSPTVVSVGAVSWTSLLVPGDFVKLAADTDAGYYKILTVDSASQVTLTSNFVELSTGPTGAQAHYAFGNYNSSPTPSTNRNIFVASRASVPSNGDVFWLFLRNDNGGAPRVYVRFLGQELDDGEDVSVSGTTSDQLLKYIGSPSSASSAPQYVSALDPNSVPQKTLLSFGTGLQTSQSSYFLINSATPARQYYVWFNVNGGGVDPNPGMGVTASVEVDILSTDTAAQVAAAVTSALNFTVAGDFFAVQQIITNQVLVTNTSAGTAGTATSGTMIAPFTVSTTQLGTGTGNTVVHDGDNLTLAIKELDDAFGLFLAAVDSPVYDEPIDIVASGATPPTSLNGPIAPTTNITLPNNSRLPGTPVQKYTVGGGFLQVYLNGVYLRLGIDWAEVGVSGSLSTQFETLRALEVGDSIELRIQGVGGGGGGGGAMGPPGPIGPQGPPGVDEAGGPIAISTKVAPSYTVMLSDNALLADCSGGVLTFFLPSASLAVGRIFYFKKIDSTANAMIIQAFGAEFIDGLNTLSTSTQYAAFTLFCDGTQYWIF